MGFSWNNLKPSNYVVTNGEHNFSLIKETKKKKKKFRRMLMNHMLHHPQVITSTGEYFYAVGIIIQSIIKITTTTFHIIK